MSEAQEKNKALVRRFLEAQANGEPDTVKEMLAPDFVVHEWSQDQDPDHRERYLKALAEERAAFSDIHYIIEDQIAEGDKVMTRWTGRGRHDRGEYAGLAPTGRDEEAKIIDLHRVEGDKIADEWKGTTASADRQEERLAQVEQELLVARRIQQASLPKEVPTLEGWQITPFYQPAREVGGDFYDFHLLSEGRLGVVVGDATGKGVPAALVMSTTCGMLQAVSHTGLIVQIGEGVLREACHQMRAWQRRYPTIPPLTVSVNLSPRQLFRPELVVEILAETEIEPGSLQLEITEGTMMSNGVHSANHTLRKLKDLSVQIAVDDFGMGYSSLSYLKRFPVDFLKIDRSFIAGLGQVANGASKDEEIVSAMVELTHALGLKAVAEGVETSEQLTRLRQMKCDLAQGNYFSEPLPSEELAVILAEDLTDRG